jgi:hypothetical protein
MMARTVSGVRLSAEERRLLERLRQERRARSWGQVLRELLQEAARREGVEGNEHQG